MKTLVLTLLCTAVLPAMAQSLCSSDGQPRPSAMLERFVNADCEGCWRDRATPKARPGELSLDWIVPGSRGDDAPLSMAASDDAAERLRMLRRPVPDRTDAVRSRAVQPARALRVAQGEPVNDYIGTSIEMPAARGASRAWLLLVEELPAGTAGSPVPRRVVRNAMRVDVRAAAALQEARPMQIHEGAQASRLRVVGLVEDARGRLVGLARSHCEAE
ncbi:MAG TPA: hypothetical protein VHA82_23150 [Ramlibacter sp.]|uniref:hypothetical protein n=1 Tax=Ramlibacter sp. TaxID=1917967 RepID=UPI002B91794E|nr:hypothetical protein [Ramlibacter sp.]HVZ46723.1 hypothetical protein [Ramlibacter sp.]